MGLIVFWIIMAVVVAMVAASKGKNPAAWFFYGVAVWPIALAHALLSERSRESVVEHAAKEGRRPCPHCAEMIMAEAKVCRFCNRDVVPTQGFRSCPRCHETIAASATQCPMCRADLSPAATSAGETLFGVPLATVAREAPPPPPPKDPDPLVDADARHYLG